MDGRNDIRVAFRGNLCGGYFVEIDCPDGTRTWGFTNINDVKLWSKILNEVIEEWERK